MSGIRIRAREYNGPSPHAVAILARNPSKLPTDNLILQNRKKDDMLAAALERTQEQTKVDLKMQWERNTTKKIIGNTIQRRVRAKLNEQSLELEERKQDLRRMLADEESNYIQQAYSMKETMEEKQARMRKKAAELKQKRETERKKTVVEKLDQQWQNQCEELRSVLTRRHQDQVCLERQHQLVQAAEIEREHQAEDMMYAELWERDRLAKAAREEKEANEAMERNYHQLDVLQSQRKEKAVKQAAGKETIKMEARQLVDDRTQLSLEIQKNTDYAKQEKSHYARRLKKQIGTRQLAKKRDYEEELAVDIKIIQQAAQEQKNEDQSEIQRRMASCQEANNYRQFLKEQRSLEAAREREIEKIIEMDVAAKDAKKAEERRKKRVARESYLAEVLQVRSQQVNCREREREEEKREAQRERERIQKIMEEHNEYQRNNNAYIRNKNRQFSRDLLSQHAFQQDMSTRQQQLDQREYENGLLTEQAYEARLREVLERRDIQQGHPLRRMADRRGDTLIFKQ